jgi:hypothetical protein
MTDTPSQDIIAAANAKVIVQDARKRQLEVRKLKTLDSMRLFEIIGADNSANQQYLGFAMLAYSVVSIDGDSVGRPTTKLALEAIVQRLDDDGFAAVAKAMKDNFLPASASEDEAMDAVKNG